MFRIKIILKILSQDETKSCVCLRETKLPFPPFNELQLSEYHGIPSNPIQRVTWSEEDQIFYCNVESKEDLLKERDMVFLISLAKKSGYSGPYDEQDNK